MKVKVCYKDKEEEVKEEVLVKVFHSKRDENKIKDNLKKIKD